MHLKKAALLQTAGIQLYNLLTFRILTGWAFERRARSILSPT
jgi:hypothetical protein